MAGNHIDNHAHTPEFCAGIGFDGGWATPLKNMNVNWDDDIPNIWENKTCSKPPTRYTVHIVPYKVTRGFDAWGSGRNRKKCVPHLRRTETKPSPSQNSGVAKVASKAI